LGKSEWLRGQFWEISKKGHICTHCVPIFLLGFEREEIKTFLVVGLRFRVTKRVTNFRNVD